MTEARARSFARRHWFALTSLALVAALAAAAALTPAHPAAAGWRHGRGEIDDPEEARERAATAVEWVLRTVDASEEQRDEAGRIAGAAAADLVGLGIQHRANREAWATLLTATEIDREALEGLRSSELALAEQASRRLVTAMADLAEVLTPEQRAELLEWAERLHR